MGVNTFNEMEIDAIGEIMNISLGASATAVSTMLGTAVHITTPVVSVVDGTDFEFRKLEPAVGVEISYVEGLEGSNVMMFSREDIRIIVGMLMGMEVPMENFELDEINRSAVCEVMNQMMGSSATALSEFLGYTVNISTPVSFEIDDEVAFKEKYFPTADRRVVARFALEVEGKIHSEFLNIMTTNLAKKLLQPFAASFGDTVAEPVEEVKQEPAKEKPQTESSSGGVLSQDAIEALMASAKEEEPKPQAGSASGGVLSQDAIEALMASAKEEEQKPQAESASGGVLSQDAIEALLAASAKEEEPKPQVQPEVLVQQAQPQQIQPQVQTQQMPVQAMQPQMVQMAPAAMDPLMLQLLTQMQQSQMQMMELMRDMKKGEKQKSQEPVSPSIIHPMNAAQLDSDDEAGEEESVNQDMLMKVPLEVSVEIGRTKKLVKDILEYTQGSLVVLDKMAGEQADLYVNGRCIARGDIVVVEDNFGIRITEIVTRNLNPEIL